MASRSRSRSPLQHNNESLPDGRTSPTPSNVSIRSNLSHKANYKLNRITGKTYNLKLSNVPQNWKWHQVLSYIKRISQVTTIAEDIAYIDLNLKSNKTQEGIIMFKSNEKRCKIFEKLRKTSERVDGKKLFINMINEKQIGAPMTKFNNFSAQKPRVNRVKDYIHTPKAAIDDDNMNETYGLSIQFLTELGITPPLTRKVFVRNLPEQYNDEAKMRSVFGIAGRLITVHILNRGTAYNARLEYDHPVEAVQAVSMFNNKEIYNRTIKCEIDSLPMIKHIDGISSSLGPGLGPNGTPMLGVRVSVELKQAKAEIMTEVQRLNETIDELKAQVMGLMQSQSNTPAIQNVPNSLPNVVNPVQSVVNPLQNVANPLAALSSLLTNQLQPMQLLQALLQQNTGNDMGVLGNTIQNMAGSKMDLSSLFQQAQANNQSGMQANMQGNPPNMQIGPNMQGGPSNNMPSGSLNILQSELQSGPQGGPNNMKRGSNNMPSGPFNMQEGPANNMQGALNNMRSGPNNMQRGSNNMPSGPFNMQEGPANNMQGAPNNMHSGPNNMQRGSNNMQSGPFNAQRGSNNMQSGPNNIQSGPPNMQQGNRPFIQGQNNHPGFNMQSNQQSGFSNMHPTSGPNQQMNTGFGGPQYDNGQDSSAQSSTMLLFTNLPNTVTLQAMQGKMREVGEVKLIEMTGPGRALVSFYSNFEAEKCIRLFNQSKVDGQTIEVRKV